jgi:hypothetical protein
MIFHAIFIENKGFLNGVQRLQYFRRFPKFGSKLLFGGFLDGIGAGTLKNN